MCQDLSSRSSQVIQRLEVSHISSGDSPQEGGQSGGIK